MSSFIRWLEERPHITRESALLWVAFTLLALFVWTFVPWALSIDPIWYLFVSHPDRREIEYVFGTSFGEECFFRAVPIFLLLLVFPRRTMWALLLGVLLAIEFATGHTRPLWMQVCIGIDGVILTVIYLKFGGASDRAFNGLLACGGSHASLNFTIMGIANVLV